MNVLVIGKGGREHAIVMALNNGTVTKKVFVLPGSAGMESEAVRLNVAMEDPTAVIQAAKDNAIDLVIIGPEDPLVAGLADQLRESGFAVFGPDRNAAQLEGSKIYSKEFMEKYAIPTAKYVVVQSVKDVQQQLGKFTPPYVLKADGLAAGKGVFICKTEADLLSAAKKIFEQNLLGTAGHTAILEQFQPGYELSFFVLTNGNDYVPLPLAQDHKKLKTGDMGPNTGGMGTVAPIQITRNLYKEIISKVVKPTIAGLHEENFVYRGVVFIGLMITDDGPSVLEYNIRFGDPETQVLLPLLHGDWGQVFKTLAEGEIPELEWKKIAATCVVLAAENYPDDPVKGTPIRGDFAKSNNHYLLHAGTDRKQDQWITNGGRVLNAVGIGKTMHQSIELAYQQAQKVSWTGMQIRRDIGKQALNLDMNRDASTESF